MTLNSKAVLFTHFSSIKYEQGIQPSAFFDRKTRQKFYQIIERLFIYNTNHDDVLGLIYCYVDWGVRRYIDLKPDPEKPDNLTNTDVFLSFTNLLSEDQSIINFLTAILNDVSNDHPECTKAAPPITFIGLRDIVQLFQNIMVVNKKLLDFLYGSFTYDTPKFVEAVIRIARGGSPYLSHHPVIRLDEDVEISEKAIRILIDEFEKSSKKNVFFYSGQYGYPEKRARLGVRMVDEPERMERFPEPHDWLNDFPVRTHSFFIPGTEPTKVRNLMSKVAASSNTGQPSDNGKWHLEESEEIAQVLSKDESQIVFWKRIANVEMFLKGMSVLGASQFKIDRISRESLIEDVFGLDVKCHFDRLGPQVVSGAGCTMSYSAVRQLPPFFNFKNLVLWVDDDIKRRLHECLGHIHKEDVECLEKAVFLQDRYGGKTSSIHVDKKEQKKYFETLLKGCMFHSIIEERQRVVYPEQRKPADNSESCLSGDETEISNVSVFCQYVDTIVRTHRGSISEDENLDLTQHFEKVCGIRYDEVMRFCCTPEFSGFKIYEWAKECQEPQNINEHKKNAISDLVQDVIEYLNLLTEWPIFVTAIEKMDTEGALWVYQEVPERRSRRSRKSERAARTPKIGSEE